MLPFTDGFWISNWFNIFSGGNWIEKAFVMENVHCGTGPSCELGRTLRIVEHSALQDKDNVVLSTFFDIYDDVSKTPHRSPKLCGCMDHTEL